MSTPQSPVQQAFSDVAETDIRAHESHGNRGKLFEGMLEKTHHKYKISGVADIDYIENAFVFCSEATFRKLPRTSKALMGDGRTLKRATTSSDYRGTLRIFGLAFDAKEFGSDRLNLKKIPRHQIESLDTFAQAGGLAGFMVFAKAVSQVYWVDAPLMRQLYMDALFKQGIKTLNLKWFAEHALHIGAVSPGCVLDYAPVLVPHRLA